MWPRARECEWPLEAGAGTEIDSLSPPPGIFWNGTWSCQHLDFSGATCSDKWCTSDLHGFKIPHRCCVWTLAWSQKVRTSLLRSHVRNTTFSSALCFLSSRAAAISDVSNNLRLLEVWQGESYEVYQSAADRPGIKGARGLSAGQTLLYPEWPAR